jgi:hypothetical protein
MVLIFLINLRMESVGLKFGMNRLGVILLVGKWPCLRMMVDAVVKKYNSIHTTVHATIRFYLPNL